MKGPERPKARVRERTTTVDPAVQAILDQVAEQTTTTEEVSAPPSMFGTPKTGMFGTAQSMFGSGGPKGMFGSGSPKGMFGKAKEVHDKALAKFGADKTARFSSGKTVQLTPFPSKGRRGNRPAPVRRHHIIPIPQQPVPSVGWFLPYCAHLDCFDDESGTLRMNLGGVGDALSFDRAWESLGYRCREEQGYHDDTGCPTGIPDYLRSQNLSHDDVDEELCTYHYLMAAPFTDLKSVLRDCDYHFYWEDCGGAWEDLIPRMQIVREMALEMVDEIIEEEFMVMGIRDWFKAAGYTGEILKDRPRMINELRDAVNNGGQTDTGVAAAFADSIVRHWPEMFGKIGSELEEAYDGIRSEGWIQPYPEEIFIFDEFWEPRMMDDHGRVALEDWYTCHKLEYHSALSKGIVTSGFMGWQLEWMTPKEPDRPTDPYWTRPILDSPSKKRRNPAA